MKKTTIHIVRHGQSLGNVDPKTSGPDPGLTEEGKARVAKRAQELRHQDFDVIYSSHLKRAVETAEILRAERTLEVRIVPRLEERDFGDLFDRPDVMEQLEAFNQALEMLTDEQHWEYKFIPQMESEREALRRFLSAMQEIIDLHSGKNILIISHGNLIRCLLVYLGEASFKELPHSSFDNAGYLKLEHAGKSLVLKEVSGLTKKKIT